MGPLRAETHCHNSFSNFHQSDGDTPYDCGVGVREQLDAALAAGLDCLFVTNHNTLDGYAQMLRERGGRARYSGLLVLPAEEVTTAGGAHLIAYGLEEPIRPGMTVAETLDEVRRQGAVSCAPHPFSLLDSLRGEAAACDLVEVFNSNNIDAISNARAAVFAAERGKPGVAGSDSHVLSTLGRCTTVVEAERTPDSVLEAMRRGRVSVGGTGYATARETLEHFRYKVENSRGYIRDYVSEHYPRTRGLFYLLLRLFERSPESYLWVLLFRLGALAMRRVSAKVDSGALDPGLVEGRDLAEMFRASL